MNLEKKVTALVVTYNRKELLKECLTTLIEQTYSLDKIIVIDNDSTDGTDEYVTQLCEQVDKINYFKLNENLGGAGGFYEGIKKSLETDYDFLWLMDDDTIPNKDSLENLVDDMQTIKEKASFLASYVYGVEGEPMNVPKISDRKEQNGYPFWYKYLDQGLVEIKSATFVSLLIKREAINTVGLPLKEYFIWGDDEEYTQRLNKYFGPGYFSGNSKVLHKRYNAKALSIKDEELKNRIPLYFYFVRNNLLNRKAYDKKIGVSLLWGSFFVQSISILFSRVKFRFSKFLVIQKGLWSFLFNYKLRRVFHNRMK